MKLRELEIENFRSFYGKNAIKFSQDPEKSITLVLGSNTAGKTAFLNAFTWTLYDDFTPGFQNPDKLINWRAIDEARKGSLVTARVSLTFDHEDKVFHVERKRTGKKVGKQEVTLVDKDVLSLAVTAEGRTTHPGNPTRAIADILPHGLYHYFFFDGERIEKMVEARGKGDIKDAIKHLMGLEVIERAIAHLDGKVEARLNEEVQDIGSPEVKKASAELSSLHTQKTNLGEELAQARKNLDALQLQEASVRKTLAEHEEAEEEERKRQHLEAENKQASDQLHENHKKLSGLIGQQGYLGFLAPLTEKCGAILSDLVEKKHIPYQYRISFVEALLEEGMCICARHLKKGEPPHASVEMLLAKAGKPEIEDAIANTRANLSLLPHRREDLYAALDEALKQRESIQRTQKATVEAIDELGRRLDKKESEDVRALNKKVAKLKEDIQKTNGSVAILSNDIYRKESEIESKEREIQKLKAKKREEEGALLRLHTCQEIIRILKEVRSRESLNIRERLATQIDSICQRMIRSSSKPHFAENYALSLVREVGGELVNAGASTSENQVLGLSFILAVISLALEREAEKGRQDLGTGFGGQFPLIMDSPFGSMDGVHKNSVCSLVPQFAPQAVFILSDSQYGGDVGQAIDAKIGTAYLMHMRTTKKDIKDETVRFQKKLHPYVSRSRNGYDFTEIEELL